MGAVLHFMVRASAVAPLSFEDEDFCARSCMFEGHGLTQSGGGSVARRPSVGLEKERLAFHLGVPRQSPSVSQLQQVFPKQLPLVCMGNQVAIIARALVTQAQGFIEYCQHRVDGRVGVTSNENKSVTLDVLRVSNVESHSGPKG